MSKRYEFVADSMVLRNSPLVAVDAFRVRARMPDDPRNVTIGFAEDDVLAGQSIAVELDEWTEAAKTSAAYLAAGDRCCLAADGRLWPGTLTPYGPGHPGIAMHAAACGDLVLVRFGLDRQELFPLPEESLARLGAALEALTAGREGR